MKAINISSEKNRSADSRTSTLFWLLLLKRGTRPRFYVVLKRRQKEFYNQKFCMRHRFAHFTWEIKSIDQRSISHQSNCRCHALAVFTLEQGDGFFNLLEGACFSRALSLALQPLITLFGPALYISGSWVGHPVKQHIQSYKRRQQCKRPAVQAYKAVNTSPPLSVTTHTVCSALLTRWSSTGFYLYLHQSVSDRGLRQQSNF